MRQHTLIGERILAVAPALRPVAGLIRSSHERWDGSGYPDGLAGEAIPLGARIIAACDAFAAMTSSRPYQRPARQMRRSASSGATAARNSTRTSPRHSADISKRRRSASTKCRDGTGSTEPGGLPSGSER